MDLQDYLRVLRKRWQLITACAALALAAAAAVILSTTPTYTATAQLFVSTQNADLNQAVAGGQFAQAQVTSYADIVTSPQVTRPVIAALGLPYTPTQLGGEISASVPLNTVLIDLSVTDASPTRAAAIANAVSQQVIGLVSQIERPAGGGSPLVKVSVVKSADVPTAPTSPKKKLDLALGLLVGLAVGVGAAVLRETLDTTVKLPADIEELTGLPMLGVIGFDPAAAKQPLVVQGEEHSARAEAFRQLRTNLQFVNVDAAPRSIVVTSAIPEEGKTTTACNLATTLAEAGVRVLLVEADLRRPRIGQYLGLDSTVGVTDVLIGRVAVDDAIQSWADGLLDVLPGGRRPPNPSEVLASQGMRDLVVDLAGRYDVVLLDAPPLLPVTDAAVMAAISDGTILVARHGHVRREQLHRAIASLAAVDASALGIVLNMMPTKGPDAYAYTYAYRYSPPGERGRRTASPSDGAQRRRNSLQASHVTPIGPSPNGAHEAAAWPAEPAQGPAEAWPAEPAQGPAEAWPAEPAQGPAEAWPAEPAQGPAEPVESPQAVDPWP